jgi:hypothetical protein
MMDLFNTRIKIREQVMKRNVDEETLILNLDNENYYGLDAVGTRFLEVLLEASSIQQAYDVLLKEYDVDPETLQTDLKKLLNLLERNGIIEII